MNFPKAAIKDDQLDRVTIKMFIIILLIQKELQTRTLDYRLIPNQFLMATHHCPPNPQLLGILNSLPPPLLGVGGGIADHTNWCHF
jgi:hypothetical protein